MRRSLISDIYQVAHAMFDSVSVQAEIENLRSQVAADIQIDSHDAPLRYVLFKTTNRCNSDCEYCAHRISNAHNERKVDVPTELAMRTVEEAADLGAHAISFSGGETLLRKDLPQLVNTCVKNRVVPVVLTNGILLPRRYKELGDAGLRYVIISFDSLKPDIYRMQRGQDLGKALKGIEAAEAMMREYPGTCINVSAVLTKDNANDLIELIEFMSEHGIGTEISPYHHYSPVEKDTLSIKDSGTIEKLTHQLLEMKDKGYLITSSRGFIQNLPDFFLAGRRIPSGYRCMLGYTNLVIDTYGNVMPCWDPNFGSIGCLGDKTLKEMWQGETMRKYRHQMLATNCSGCWYMCTAEVQMLLQDRL